MKVFFSFAWYMYCRSLNLDTSKIQLPNTPHGEFAFRQIQMRGVYITTPMKKLGVRTFEKSSKADQPVAHRSIWQIAIDTPEPEILPRNPRIPSTVMFESPPFCVVMLAPSMMRYPITSTPKRNRTNEITMNIAANSFMCASLSASPVLLSNNSLQRGRQKGKKPFKKSSQMRITEAEILVYSLPGLDN